MRKEIVYIVAHSQMVACEVESIKMTMFGKKYLLRIQYKSGKFELTTRMWWNVWSVKETI